ncbi:LOW QUALITY PROTEIN: hypothetical protein SSOG_07240, partial [Streptomyces himastatinicus ATCC 53653]
MGGVLDDGEDVALAENVIRPGRKPALGLAVVGLVARVGALAWRRPQRGPLAGLPSAAQLVADPGPDNSTPNAVGIAARSYPDGTTTIAWVGDCRAYGWNGRRLRQYGKDHSMREHLLCNGAPWDVAEAHANWVRTTLAHATVAMVYETELHDPLVILTSEGVHDAVDDAGPWSAWCMSTPRIRRPSRPPSSARPGRTRTVIGTTPPPSYSPCATTPS